MKKINQNLINNKKAFTLIEVLLTVAIVSLVILIGTNVYFSVAKIQRRVAAMQKVQDDVRYVLEKMSQSVRLGLINYDFYNDPNDDGVLDSSGPNQSIDLYPGSNNVYMLAVIDQVGNEIFYRRSSKLGGLNDGEGDKIQFCQQKSDETECYLDNDLLWDDITPEGVTINNLEFFITPSGNPFKELDGLPCNDDGDCTGTTDPEYVSYNKCFDELCRYYTDNHNFQPKVKIVLDAESGKITAEKMSIGLQTIVTSRLPMSEVRNLNYE